MNIFVLSPTPSVCAKMHCDKHVVKMILESAQMMCTAHHLHPNGDYDIPYKKTHINHPCSKWVRDSKQNYQWLYDLTKYLNDEYKFRYNKDVDHKSWTVVKDLPVPDIPNVPMTRWARAMPDECKIGNDVVESYKTYYKTKGKILTYKNRVRPRWL